MYSKICFNLYLELLILRKQPLKHFNNAFKSHDCFLLRELTYTLAPQHIER